MGPPNSLHQVALQNSQSLAQQGLQSSNLFTQVPISVRHAKMPEYFPEWKDVGFEEAAFLGAQTAAKVIFLVDQGPGGGQWYLSRVQYNEKGPSGILSTA